MTVETIILRFRDLSTNPGETIAFHREKIKEHSFAGWGWWNKAGETIPAETFIELTDRINKSNGLKIILHNPSNFCYGSR